jgi:hypothetical protein
MQDLEKKSTNAGVMQSIETQSRPKYGQYEFGVQAKSDYNVSKFLMCSL